MRMRKLRAVFGWVAISLLVVASLASAEPYFGLYGGVVFPEESKVKFSEFPLRVPSPSRFDVTVGQEGFDTSGILGGKFGYFLGPLPFLGFELDVFNIFGPDINANATRTLDVKGVPVGNLKAPLSSFFNTGSDIELRTTGVLLDVVGRFPLMRSQEFPNGRLQPYVGVGGGWINAQLSLDNPPLGGSRNDVTDAIGAQGIAGLKFFLMPNVALFTEYK